MAETADAEAAFAVSIRYKAGSVKPYIAGQSSNGGLRLTAMNSYPSGA